jgi:hypothetical protein
MIIIDPGEDKSELIHYGKREALARVLQRGWISEHR